MDKIYLDYAAATPVDRQVFLAMEPYFSDEFFNPSAVYLDARRTRENLEKARSEVAGCLGARPAEVIFTAGATEANNMAVQGVMKRYPEGEVLVCATEHESVLEPAKQYRHKLIPVGKDGLINLAKLPGLITNETALVCIGMVNNETGVTQPLAKIAQIISRANQPRGGKPILFHTDAAQAPNYFDIHIARLGVDLMSLNGGKIYGPKQSGVLFAKAGVELEPLIYGGGQESGLRSGTENVAGAIGLAAALNAAQQNRKAEAKRVKLLRELFIQGITAKIPSARVNGSIKVSSPHIVSLTFPEVDNERLIMELDEQGIQAAAGSACSASDGQPSHVLAAMGLPEKDIRSTLRFSFGRRTAEDDIRRAIAALSKLLD
ncbi:MAG TPA: cysteine desulfurase family protein [Candidatus Saccharimonadales bacterium]|nr:cysteine desulfurase family protein [Candidatus Saccharimonadales bacterium]